MRKWAFPCDLFVLGWITALFLALNKIYVDKDTNILAPNKSFVDWVQTEKIARA